MCFFVFRSIIKRDGKEREFFFLWVCVCVCVCVCLCFFFLFFFYFYWGPNVAHIRSVLVIMYMNITGVDILNLFLRCTQIECKYYHISRRAVKATIYFKIKNTVCEQTAYIPVLYNVSNWCTVPDGQSGERNWRVFLLVFSPRSPINLNRFFFSFLKRSEITNGFLISQTARWRKIIIPYHVKWVSWKSTTLFVCFCLHSLCVCWICWLNTYLWCGYMPSYWWPVCSC